MPTWFPWLLVGGILFILLGWIGTKYKDKEYRPIQSLQDFISGSILIAVTGIAMPDLFPSFESVSALIDPLSVFMNGGMAHPSDQEDILQVGPPRLVGRPFSSS